MIGVSGYHPRLSSSSSYAVLIMITDNEEPCRQFAWTHRRLRDLILPAILLFSWLSDPCYASCSILDRDALLSFSSAISSSSSPLIWIPEIDCCNWEGISCDGNYRVARLWLPSRGLFGEIPSSIANLTFLSQFNVSNNWLSGPLPDGFFKSLTQLQIVDLSCNRLSGSLSPSDSLPATVQGVNLSSNHFNGTVRSSFLRPAFNLVSFNISNNSFTGFIPSSSICLNSPSIMHLDFSFNNFMGQIPLGFGGCSRLEALRAGFNELTGQLPDDIHSATALQEIFLPANQLFGPINEGIVNLTNLRVLALFGNGFTGRIPLEIGKLSSLEQMLLHINYLNGTLPPSLTNCSRLIALNLRVNDFEGELSSLDFSRFIRLSTIDLGNNLFTGSLPTSLFSCKSLTAIRLATNNLEGEILPDILALRSLSFLSLSNNSLTNITGTIKILMGCKNLSAVTLSKNFYNEAMPDDDGMLRFEGFQNLQVMALGGCKFTGRIPTWLAKLQKLEVLDLSVNQFTGTIPSWLGNLSNLFYIDLSENLLQGNFPIELTGLRRLASRQGADQIDTSHLELPVFVQPKNASYQQYNQLSNLPPAIYLRNNNLSGNIPIEIGQLKFIHVLDLSYNMFSGSIPEQISNLINLERLDLSGNNLTGAIPASLRNLHFLSFFSVANNGLEGLIPFGDQFDTFPNSSYEGNARLCGAIVQRACSNQSANTHPASPRKKIIAGLIFGICSGISIALSVLALCVLSKRRILSRGSSPDNNICSDMLSFNSNSVISTELGKDNSLVILFPNNANQVKDLTVSEILKATDNFSQENIIGCGGFGLVYKAILTDGTTLAVKKLSGDMGLIEREFKAEVEALSTAQHKNLVSLRGYCVHNGFRLLMYSYMENGSLDYWLHEKTDGAAQLDWPTRLKIAQGASFGLEYMHQICEPHIVHRDIKSSNILLDNKFEAHVADFGLSRLILPYHTHVTTELFGTLGYIPPEYSQAWIATLRGDMYSFGVVILELLTGRRPMEIFRPKMSRELVTWVLLMRREGKQDQVFDPHLLRGKGFEGEEEEMLQVLDVACMCVNQNPFKRPTIKEVVGWLKNVGSDRQTPK